jgi:1-acyl-sn-glycerol-3-phosphate acyltransferase
VIFLFLDRVCFRESDRTPDSPVYALIFFLIRLWLGKTKGLHIEDAALHTIEAPYLMLCNHESFFDFYYISQMSHPRNPSYLINEFYTARPLAHTVAKKAGILSKKLFTPDMGSAAGIMRTLRKGFPVVVFPEGRLSPDGRSNPIAEPGGRLYRKLGVPLVLVRISGAYYAAPKWRARRLRTEIRVTVERVLTPEELRAMPEAALDRLITETLYTDEAAGTRSPVRRGGRAKGLENVLYRCADCGALYTTASEGNTLRCSECGAVHTLDEHYRFTTGPASIPDYYAAIRERERGELDALALFCAVDTKIFDQHGRPRRETGECRLTREAFSYRSASEEFDISTANLPALAFSCGTEFELYHGGELHYFYPKTQPQQTARWALAVDLLAQQRRERTATCQNGTPTTKDRT